MITAEESCSISVANNPAAIHQSPEVPAQEFTLESSKPDKEDKSLNFASESECGKCFGCKNGVTCEGTSEPGQRFQEPPKRTISGVASQIITQGTTPPQLCVASELSEEQNSVISSVLQPDPPVTSVEKKHGSPSSCHSVPRQRMGFRPRPLGPRPLLKRSGAKSGSGKTSDNIAHASEIHSAPSQYSGSPEVPDVRNIAIEWTPLVGSTLKCTKSGKYKRVRIRETKEIRVFDISEAVQGGRYSHTTTDTFECVDPLFNAHREEPEPVIRAPTYRHVVSGRVNICKLIILEDRA